LALCAFARARIQSSIVSSNQKFGALGLSDVLPSGAGNSLALILRLVCWRDHGMPLLARSQWSRTLKGRRRMMCRPVAAHSMSASAHGKRKFRDKNHQK
jgi:hypothetical protein